MRPNRNYSGTYDFETINRQDVEYIPRCRRIDDSGPSPIE
jgi:hypothetical protein